MEYEQDEQERGFRMDKDGKGLNETGWSMNRINRKEDIIRTEKG